MSSIFISYRRNGALVHARALFERLRHEFGANEVFIDLDGIEYGVDFVDLLNEQLNGCKVMLAVMDPEWATAIDKQGRRRIDREGDYVRVEITTALERGIRTVPVLISGAEMPDADDLPEALRPLVRRNALPLDFTRFDAEVKPLIAAIRKILSAPDAAGPPDTPRVAVGAAIKSREAQAQEAGRLAEEALRKQKAAEAAQRRASPPPPTARFNLWRFYFSFKGRIGRREYWRYMMLPWLIATVVLLLIASSLTGHDTDRESIMGLIGLVFIVMAISTVIICVKRFHDLGRSGRWAILACIPYISFVVILVLGCKRGQTGHNAYGDDPLQAGHG